MTNKEKAREIAECNDGHINIISFESAKIMAEWKDQQFKEYLENLKNAYIKDNNNLFNRGLTMSSEHYNSQIECIDEIINELFKQD